MKHIYLLFFLCLLCSCKESAKEKIARLVREWDGKEISFPSHSVFTIQGKDTVDFSFADAEYKIVTYIDSVGCTSCKLQLPRWKEFMHEVDSLAQGKVPFVFYFHPKDVKELRYITRRDAFTYPVCLDEKDDFNAFMAADTIALPLETLSYDQPHPSETLPENSVAYLVKNKGLAEFSIDGGRTYWRLAE